MNLFITGAVPMFVSGIGNTILGGLFIIAVIIGVGWFQRTGGFNLKKRYLLKHGVAIDANVDSIEKTIFNVGSSGNTRPVMKIVLSFEDAYKSIHQVTIRHAFSFGAPVPNEGDQVHILIDSSNPERIMIAPGSA